MAHGARGEQHDVRRVLLAKRLHEEGDEDVDRERAHRVLRTDAQQLAQLGQRRELPTVVVGLDALALVGRFALGRLHRLRATLDRMHAPRRRIHQTLRGCARVPLLRYLRPTPSKKPPSALDSSPNREPWPSLPAHSAHPLSRTHPTALSFLGFNLSLRALEISLAYAVLSASVIQSQTNVGLALALKASARLRHHCLERARAAQQVEPVEAGVGALALRHRRRP